MHDGPDPSDDDTSGEPLDDTPDEGILVELLAGAGGDHGSKTSPEDVHDEEGEGAARVERDNGLLALGAAVILTFTFFSHLFKFLFIKVGEQI